MEMTCGIDLGGTKIEGVLLNLEGEGYEVIERLRIATENENGYEHIVRQIVKVVRQLESNCNIQLSTLGIGTPGTLDPASQTLKNSNTTCLNGQPLKQDLETALGFDIQMANDANCFALAEATLGIVKEKTPEAEVVFGVIMGTGVGGGVVINGKVRNGKQGIGGEWGHNFLDYSGGDCYCGNVGCVEKVISGTALEKYYHEISGTKKNLKEIMRAFESGSDSNAKETVDRLLNFFGKGLASVINVLDPDAVVLGGGVGNIDLLYNLGAKNVEDYLFNNKLETPILKPKLGDSAGVFGAAMLVS
ncbi:MAG: ROK family protein [Cyclobacteriaceae bacterium]